jgi:FtsP/CotA-like multicopper oxidase with cupredoxin domain
VTIVGPLRRQGVPARVAVVLALLAAAVAVRLPGSTDAADAAAADPYRIEAAVDADPDPTVFETTLVAKQATVDIGNGVTAAAWTYNGTVPGPEIRVQVGDTVVVHFRNELPLPSGIHWHGIELPNAADGTALTQNAVPVGGTFLYRFIVPRPGLFWYHPHHNATNPVFKGQYGSLIVEDPHDDTLRAHGVLPSRDRTTTLVVSDTTVCKEPGHNDTDTYPDTLPWILGSSAPEQPGPTPSTLCDTPMDEHGNPVRDANGRPVPLRAGEIPNIQRATAGRTNEGQTVLANGRDPGGRGGTPAAPGALAEGASTWAVPAGQGVRLQAVNTATTRWVRLLLTDTTGRKVPLVRVGGEGGLLDNARIEGGSIGGLHPTIPHKFETQYTPGEILLAPSERADVVAALPRDTPLGVATVWTQDFPRTGGAFSNIPTVPVMHLDVTAPTVETYTITAGTPLRTHPAVADPVEPLGPPVGPVPDLPDLGGTFDPLLDPATFGPPKPGTADRNIRLTTAGAAPTVDDIAATHDGTGSDYTAVPHTASTRYARLGDLLELTVSNETSAHHPFHLHGYSFQPVSLEHETAADYVFEYREFVDTVDIPPHFRLRFRVRLDDRPQMDGATPGGGLGRWVLHCHIFFHASLGMNAELVVVPPDGNEKPTVDSDRARVAVDQGMVAGTSGRFGDPDGDEVTLAASSGVVRTTGGGRWEWQGALGEADAGTRTVYITATDATGLQGQTAFVVDIANAAPTVEILSPVDGASFTPGSVVAVTASITDPGGGRGLACRFDWDDGAGLSPLVAAVDGTCQDTRRVLQAGMRTVVVEGSDGDGGADLDSTLVVVSSVAGSAVGKGTTASGAFDFSARFGRHPHPTGHARFRGGGIDLRATTLRWLVISGSEAAFRGAADVNGVAGFDFVVSATDNPDGFRLRVWRAADGVTVYDNAPGLPDDIDRFDPPPVTTGAVTISPV